MSFAKQAVLSDTILTDTIITAERQLSGKGRWGRSWNSPDGNLYYTRVLPENRLLKPFEYSQIGALAVLSSVRHLGCKQVSLKWPNDILWNGKKLAGILVERFFHQESAWISTGIGINVLMQSDKGECSHLNAASLSLILEKAMSIPEVLASLCSWHTHWLESSLQNPKALHEEWKSALSWMKGMNLKTHRKEKTLSGTVMDILEDGSLTILLEDGTQERVLSEWIEISSPT